ncbi:MAG: hypothetical protein HQL51_16125 [Magnetococcales bacterium]|nr:hypothetical protein [Magnetococcales bacterium]
MPSAPQPQEVLKSLMEEAVKHPFGSRVSPFILNRWRNEARKLTGKFPADAYHLLALVAGFEGDETAMRECFANALRFEPEQIVIIHNYMMWLFTFGRMDEGVEIGRKYHQTHPESDQGLINYFNALLWTGKYSEISRLFQNPERRTRVESVMDLKEFNKLQDCLSHQVRWGLSDEDIASTLRIACNLLMNKAVQLSGIRIDLLIDPEEEIEWICFRMELDRPIAEIVQLEFDLADRIVDADLPSCVTDHVLVGFSPHIKEPVSNER